MPGEPLLLGIATIAIVVAGFTGVTSAMTPSDGSWPPAMRIRQRAIVSTSFNVVFEALAPVIAFAWLDDPRGAFMLTSLIVAVYLTGIVTWRGRQLWRAGGNRTGSALVLFALGPIATLLFWANAIAIGGLVVYALALCIQLGVAAVSFYSLVSAAEG